MQTQQVTRAPFFKPLSPPSMTQTSQSSEGCQERLTEKQRAAQTTVTRNKGESVFCGTSSRLEVEDVFSSAWLVRTRACSSWKRVPTPLLFRAVTSLQVLFLRVTHETSVVVLPHYGLLIMHPLFCFVGRFVMGHNTKCLTPRQAATGSRENSSMEVVYRVGAETEGV